MHYILEDFHENFPGSLPKFGSDLKNMHIQKHSNDFKREKLQNKTRALSNKKRFQKIRALSNKRLPNEKYDI